MSDSQVDLMRALHDEHAASLWGYCLRLTGGDHARAQDVVQETLLRAWRHPSVLDQSQRSARSWLFTVARNVVIDDWRTRRSRLELSTGDVPEVVPARPDRRAAAVLDGRRRLCRTCPRTTARSSSSATTGDGPWPTRRSVWACPSAR